MFAISCLTSIFVLLIFTKPMKSNETSTSQSSYALIEYQEIKYCFSSMDLLDGSQSSNYFILKHDFGKNCTHVNGNIFINNVIKELNGSEPDLEFLSSIREITGSLKIQNSNVSIIPLRNLRIIRGITKLYKYDYVSLQNSLEINWDFVSTSPIRTVIDLRSLRSIVNGNIRISPSFCQSVANIEWEELLEDPGRQNITGVCKFSFFKCSANCNLRHNKKFCWGPESTQCQIFSKCKKRMCDNRCFLSDNGDEECCHSQCLGGCHSSTPGSCIACQTVLDGETCQSECPPKKVFNRDSGILVENKFFRPLFVNVCLKKCPDGLLEQEGECKSQCTFKKYERKGDQCVPCEKFCEEICAIEDIFTENQIEHSYISLDATKIKKLENCTTFKGPIVIDGESFKPHRNLVPITEESQLWFLSNLRKISGIVYIDLKFAKFNLESLSFLYNLQVIEGHYRDISSSLGVFNSNISYLGLTNLKTIGTKGLKSHPILFKNNSNLCYFSSDKLKQILKFEEIITIDGIAEPEICKNRGQICSNECNPSHGCWGPGPNQCVDCANMKLGRLCASNCLAKPGYFANTDSNSKICLTCHNECYKTCYGIRSDQCIGGCKYAMENMKCVSQCSRTHYINNRTKICEPCHIDCHPRNLTKLPVCTGPSYKPGFGGCNKCQSLVLKIVNNKEEPERCYNRPHLPEYFSDNRHNRGESQFSKFIEKFTDLFVIYQPCHPLCSTCTFYTDQRFRISTTDLNGCTECKGYWYDNKCLSKCPLNFTYLRSDITNSSYGICQRCNPQCNGCYGDSNEKCVKCNNFVLYNENNLTQFSCVEKCPPNYKHDYFNVNLNQTICSFVRLSKLELILVVLAMIFFLFVLIFIVIITNTFRLRKKKHRKEKLNAYFSNVNEKDSHEIDDKPNMNQLLVISSDNLEYTLAGEILGKGTFGSVYAGKWKPDETYLDSSIIDSCKDKKIDVVIKVLNESCDLNEFMEEVQIMASVRHKHCLRLIGMSFHGSHKLLISSYMPLGSVDKYLVKYKSDLSAKVLLLWTEQIANGMLYLERNHIIHRDLATRNVLIYNKEHIQITDFGLSKVMKRHKDGIKILGGMVPVRWLAIETLREGIYSHKTDVWAYGVTVWEIFTFGKVPYDPIKAHEIREEIIKGTRLCQPEICSLDIYILMLKCWSIEPDERPAFENLWSEFKMFSNNPETYLSHPNIESQYKNDSSNNYIYVVPKEDDLDFNTIRQPGTPLRLISLNESLRTRTSPSPIIIPDNIRPLLSEEPIRNFLYQSANNFETSNSNLNESFNKYNGINNFQAHQDRLDYLSPSQFTREYLEPLSTLT